MLLQEEVCVALNRRSIKLRTRGRRRLRAPSVEVSSAHARKRICVVGAGYNSSRINSMSQGFHQGIFSFSASEQEQHHHQQSRRDKLRVQGFIDTAAAAASRAHPLGIEEGEDDGDDDVQGGRGGIYEPHAGAANMLSEMFNFPTAAAAAVPTATELLASQMHGAGYRLPSGPALQGSMAGFGGDWYGGVGSSNLDTISADAKQLNPESAAAAAMQLFLMNPHQQQPTSPPPPPPHHHHQQQQQQEHPFVTHEAASFAGGQLVDSQGLSLSLSSSLHQFDMAKADQNVLYFNQSQQPPQQQQQLQQSQVYNGAAVGVSLLRNSVYARAAQELLEEFCSVGRGHFRGSRGKHSSSSNPNPSAAAAAAGGGGASSSAAAGSSSSSKDVPPLSPADRFEHQRKKSKLLSMLDEASGQKIQPLLRADADDGDLVRQHDGARRGDPVHGAGAEGDVAALPVPEGRDRGAAEAELRGPGREGRRGGGRASPRGRRRGSGCSTRA
ncbi:putative BEL1-like homeodomain protein 4 [Iris pallida]|uniref:BEL1-like homeodomain protein 4 n=1 Tax=Iris pallida TaxID=29817 RepID=A0AAX6I4L4_IRIPA|nr:putative BEL1-like homeodomain protein 4 [Iris pallida]